jgi:Glycosyl hydrolase catalytic core
MKHLGVWLAVAGAVLASAPAAAAAPAAHVTVGVGEQTSRLFGDPRFTLTGVRHVRLIVPYDVVHARGKVLRWTDDWLDGARARGLDPLVTFNHAWIGKRRWHLPTVREYATRVREFRRRYPWVHEYATWNEANHKRDQPTGLHPVRTAAFFRALRRQCRAAGCKVVAADVLVSDSPRTWRWLEAFRRAAGRVPLRWGLHNYPDANRFSTRRTRKFLRRLPGQIWFTETGGVVKFGNRFARNERRAARAVAQVFRLTRLSPRITRVYFYNWRAQPGARRWDSGLIAASGRTRPAFRILVRYLGQARYRPVQPLLEPPPLALDEPPEPEPKPAPPPKPPPPPPPPPTTTPTTTTPGD